MVHSIYSEAGFRIWQLRNEQKYTREQLAELADISVKFLYEIEVGRKGFSAMTLCRLARSLDVKCDYILNGEE